MMKGYREPNYDEVLPAIVHLSDENLKEYINDDEKVETMVKGFDQCKELETEKEMMMAQNKSIAEYNLKLSPKLESGKTRLKELCDSVQSVTESVEEKQSQLQNHSGNISSNTVLSLLQASAVESEEQSERLAEQFYQNEIDIEEFIDQFQIYRKLMHLRKVKADKLEDILKGRSIGGSASGAKGPAPNVPYPSLPYPALTPAPMVPYPIGNMNMPYFPMSK